MAVATSLLVNAGPLFLPHGFFIVSLLCHSWWHRLTDDLAESCCPLGCLVPLPRDGYFLVSTYDARSSHFVPLSMGPHTILFPRLPCPQSFNIYPSCFCHCPSSVFILTSGYFSCPQNGCPSALPQALPIGRIHLILVLKVTSG